MEEAVAAAAAQVSRDPSAARSTTDTAPLVFETRPFEVLHQVHTEREREEREKRER